MLPPRKLLSVAVLACCFAGCGQGTTTSTSFIQSYYPFSTLLPPGSSSLAFTLETGRPASCGYSVGKDAAYSGMTPFETGQGSTQHGVTFQGLDPDTTVVNHVYVRCDADAVTYLDLRFRSLPAANPSFPRKGNLWGSGQVTWSGGLEHGKRIDLWLGADFDETQVGQLRALNPEVVILDSVSTVDRLDADSLGIPDDYWLRDVHGKRIEVWNGDYRLNLTRPEVARFLALYAYQRQLDKDLSMDGMFFDNFFTAQSGLTKDMWGNAVEIDADGDGRPDDPAWLDAAWRAGVFAELQTWRLLMPWAYATGHLPAPATDDVAAIFNGDSLGFLAPGSKDGTDSFADLWEAYGSWATKGLSPNITMIESGPPFEIAYGYGYQPQNAVPNTTLEFARTYYPYMRWGLGVALMNDGYFAHEFGDTWHGNDWWYDELDYDLGHPLGPAARLTVESTPTTDAIVDGGCEGTAAEDWSTWVDVGAAATFAKDTTVAASGAASCELLITNAGQGTDRSVALFQSNLSTVKGTSYDLKFGIKSDASHPFSVALQKGTSDWHSYGLGRSLMATAQWQSFTVTFEATDTASDGRLSFNVGAKTGSVWIDDVTLVQHPPDVYRRDFDHGAVILNATRQRRTIAVSGSLARLSGTQAPRYQYVVDDADSGFTAGDWSATSYDSGQLAAVGPWYHDWGSGCHQSSIGGDDASWDLGVRADDTYTLDAWWPAAPAAAGWSTQVLYEVVAGGQVLTSAIFDQTQGGDEWHRIGSVALTQATGAQVRITNLQNKPAIADAILVQSTARYNDGSDASSVELDPMDAIVLRRK